MSFMVQITLWLATARDWFLTVYYQVSGWLYPFYYLATPFYYFYLAFGNLVKYFLQFNEWLTDASNKISQILSLDAIVSYFQTWMNYAFAAYNWIINAANIILYNISVWWNSFFPQLQLWIDQRIRDLATVSEAFKNTVLSWIADVRSWTTIQLNSLQNTFSILISGVQSWTTTQLNGLQNTFSILISGVQSWATTTINNVKSTILATISDLSIWTSTEINTIRSLLANLLDWNTLTSWISNWWKQRLLDIQSLFNSWALQLTPFWAGWQEIRDKVFKFFNNPLEWLLAEFTDWFLGGG